MFDKVVSHYNVIISDYASSIGGYRYLRTEKCYTEEEAVELAKRYLADKAVQYKARIEQVCTLLNWL